MSHAKYWRLESEVNPRKDIVTITERYVNKYTGKHSKLIIPESLSREERLNYPMRIKDELKPTFKQEINRRIIPALRRRDYDAQPYVRFTSIVEVKNNEGEIRVRPVHTRKWRIRIRSGAERNRFFEEITRKWEGVFKSFRSENWIRRIGDVFGTFEDEEEPLNPEIEMNQEEKNYNNSWDYWTLYSIKSFTLEIEFTFRDNNPKMFHRC